MSDDRFLIWLFLGFVVVAVGIPTLILALEG